MIPKKIHYCWFGGKEKPRSVLEYIETWKKFLPDYEIKEWNEKNFDVNKFSYTKEAYYAKKYAFVSDVARLYALVNEGGIYFDTDIRVLKSFPDSLLSNKAFTSFEHDINVATGVLGSEPFNPLFVRFLDFYTKLNFFCRLKYNDAPNVNYFTRMLEQYEGLKRNNKCQILENITVYPQVYFCANDCRTGIRYNNDDTYTIHEFSGTWCAQKNTFLKRLKNRIDMSLVILKYKCSRRLFLIK